MLDKIVALIRKPTPTSAELRAALATIDVKAAEAAVDSLEAERQKLLLRPDNDAELEQFEVRIRAANRAVERQCAAERELQRLVTEAEARENEEQIELQAAEAQRAAQELTKSYAEIDRLTDTMKARLGEASSSAKTVALWNRKAEKIGQPDRRIHYIDPGAAKQRLAGTFR